MTIKILKILLGCFLITTTAFASRMDPSYGDGGWPFVATLNLGPAWARPGETQTLILQPEIQKTYVPNPKSRELKLTSTARGTDPLFAGEVFLGLYGPINSVVEGQVGVALSTTSQVKLSGSVYEDNDPVFNNFAYSYSVRNYRVALKGKILYDARFYELYPYLSGSAALSFNRSTAFTLLPRIFEEVPAPIFMNQTKTEFGYTIGTGLETLLDDNWRVGLGYEFADWGLSSLSRAKGQTVGTGLHLTSLRTHELQVSLTFIT